MSGKNYSMEAIFTKAWAHRGIFARVLWPLSQIFYLLIFIRRALYTAGIFTVTTLPVPVIVVGNIFVGGTGKTPLVIWLVRQLRARGFVPGVVSRGYGGDVAQVQLVTFNSSVAQVGDEPLLIAQKTGAPVTVGRDRVAAARALLSHHPDVNVIVCDDGLQHYALGRTVEIQLSDRRGNGNGWLLPAGPLREPVSRSSDFYVVNGGRPAGKNRFGMQISGGYAEQLIRRSHRLDFATLAAQQTGRPVAALAGIGNPQAFFAMLRASGLKLSAQRALPDHDDFSGAPLAGLSATRILMTEKDAVKCAGIPALANDARLWVVPIEATINGPLVEKIVEKLRGQPTA